MPTETRSKPSQWLPLAVFAAVTCTFLLFAPNYEWHNEETANAYGADFLQEWVGARMILTGHASELYDTETFRAWQYDPTVVGFAWKTDQYFPPVYPPPHYMLFSPLACIPYRWAVVVWLLFLIVAAWYSAKLIADIANRYASDSSAEKATQSLAKTQFVWLGLILFPSLLFSITLGQKSVVWLLIVCAAWRLLQTNRDYLAGMVFGLLSVKPTLFFLLPLVLLRNGRWSFFAGASNSVAILWGTAFCILPLETWIAFAKGINAAGSYAENIGYRLDWSCNLLTLAYSMPNNMIGVCKWGFCLPLSIYLLYCVFEDRKHAIASPEKAMLVLGTTILLSPHTYHYDLCILLLPILWLAVTAPREGIAYYAMLAVGISVASEAQEVMHLPIVPILLVGMVCELRLRDLWLRSSVGSLCKLA